jgi:outer membrane protein assembly factor BamB
LEVDTVTNQHSGQFAAVDADTGETIWYKRIPVAQGGSQSISGDTIFSPGSDGVIWAQDVNTGQVKWTYHGGFNPKGYTGHTSSTALDEKHGWVLGTTETGHLFVLDKNTGRLVRNAYLGVPEWNHGDPQPSSGYWFAGTSSMAIVPSQTLLYIAGTDFDRTWQGQFHQSKEKLFCYDYGGPGDKLKLVWEYQFCSDNDECGDLDSQHIVRGWDEQTISFYTLPSPALADGHVYYSSYNGKVYCFGAAFDSTNQLCPAEELYGEDSEEAELLKSFRDNVLSKTPEGQKIEKLYYEWSPVIVKEMENNEAFKEEVKEIIDEILSLLRGETE